MKALKLVTAFEEHEAEKAFRIPEHDLMASILASAVSDAAGVGQWVAGNGKRSRRRRQEEARRWILSDAVYCAPGLGISFQFICEVLDVDATSIRKTTKNNPEAIIKLMTTFRDRSMKRRMSVSEIASSNAVTAGSSSEKSWSLESKSRIATWPPREQILKAPSTR